ncbi:MAG: transglutaminase-like domain-containing protein [Nitrospirota bacterium]
MERTHRRILSIGIILFWFLMLGLLYQRHYGPLWKTSSRVVAHRPESISEEEKERWMGIYLKGEKIGYAYISKKKEKDGYRFREKLSMMLNVMGSTQKVDTVTEASLDNDYVLRSFSFRIVSDITSTEINGEVRGKKMKLIITSGGDRRVEEISLKDTPYMNLGLTEKLVMEGLKPGKSLKALIFDPSSMSQQEFNIVVEGKERIRVLGSDVDAYRLRADFKGINIISWVDEKGETLKEESPLGLVLIKEPEKDAIGRGSVAKADIITATVIFPNIDIKEPEKVTYLKLKLKDVPLQTLNGFKGLSGGRQNLNKDILEIRKEDLNRISNIKYQISKFEERKFKEFLSPTSLLQSNDPRIANKAKEIIGEEKDILNASRLLMEWVYTNIEKRPTISIPNALEVLRMKQGDCNEHTTLYTALARSAGIPAKIDIGLVYSKGGFYYHAWPEVFAGEWVSLDPTLNQFPADGTHIKFIEGNLDKQVEILGIVGRLSIEILEYR